MPSPEPPLWPPPYSRAPRWRRWLPGRLSTWLDHSRRGPAAHEQQEQVDLPPYPEAPSYAEITRSDMRPYLEWDTRVFSQDGVKQLFAVSSQDLRVLVATFRDSDPARLKAPQHLVLRAEDRLPNIAEYSTSYGRFARAHWRLRNAPDRAGDYRLFIGVRAKVAVPDARRLRAPLDSLKVYASVDNLHAAQVHTDTERYPNLCARPLPSTMEDAADIFRAADDLVRSGLL